MRVVLEQAQYPFVVIVQVSDYTENPQVIVHGFDYIKTPHNSHKHI